MTASEIIYKALEHVQTQCNTFGVTYCEDSLRNMAIECVWRIREEFKKAGVDVWKGGET